MQSNQWLTKNFFSVGKNVSDRPIMGRKAVLIWSATSTKITTQVFSPAEERALE